MSYSLSLQRFLSMCSRSRAFSLAASEAIPFGEDESVVGLAINFLKEISLSAKSVEKDCRASLRCARNDTILDKFVVKPSLVEVKGRGL